MACERYAEELKVDADKRVTVNNHTIADVIQDFGVTIKRMCSWRGYYGMSAERYRVNQTSWGLDPW